MPQDSEVKSCTYKLCYFNFRARAELARLLFAVAGVDYVDERVTRMEQWMKIKQLLPFGQLPILYVDDVMITQSHSIARFLAREFNFLGHTSIEQAQADMVVDSVIDMMDPIMPAYREEDIQKKKDMVESYEKELPKFMEKMEKLLLTNKSASGYFVGDKLTWADLSVMNAWYWIPGFGVTPEMEKYPKLLEHKQLIEHIPEVADWIEKRPETPI